MEGRSRSWGGLQPHTQVHATSQTIDQAQTYLRRCVRSHVPRVACIQIPQACGEPVFTRHEGVVTEGHSTNDHTQRRMLWKRERGGIGGGAVTLT
jgi:hypothetical protein